MNQTKQSAFVLQWADLLRWDLKSARASAFRATHPSFRPLGEFIEESTETEHPYKLPDHEWPVYGVNNKEGVVFSHLQRGDAFKSSYKRIRKDWFFHNPTRANVGSLGRVPAVPEDALTSPEYQVWRIRRGLLPAFVDILIRLPFFLDLISYHRVGAVKERLFVENLCEIPIPVLTESEQEAIVRQWHLALAKAEEGFKQIARRRKEMDSRFLMDLGLQSPDYLSVPKAFAVDWRDLTRWGVGFTFLNKSGADLSSGTYPVSDLGSLITMVQYGTSEKANLSEQGTPIIRMNNIVNGELDLKNLKHVSLSEHEIEKLLLEEGDILFNRTNSKELVGKCACFNVSGEFVFASYLIRLRADRSKADPEYLAQVINSPIGRQQIDALSRQILGQANINSEELRGLAIPIPPPSMQRKLMSRIRKEKEEIAKEQGLLDQRRLNIVREMEALILQSGTTNGS
jgi:type I restriction enzyme, S subunit